MELHPAAAYDVRFKFIWERQLPMEKRYPKVSLPGTHFRTLSSTAIDQEFSLFISLPPDYSGVEDSYPVLYVLDGNFLFGMVTEIVRGLNLGQELPDMIIVGVAYPVDDIPQTFPFRTRDYTPTKVTDEENSGGAADFMNFIQNELFPFMDSNYRTDQKDRAIVGYSLGGLLALYILFHKPDLFQRYVLSSPAIGWDKKVTFAYETQYAEKNNRLPVRVFMSVGSLENEEFMIDLQRFAEVVSDRKYAGMRFRYHIFEDETHLSVPATSFSKGLRDVFG